MSNTSSYLNAIKKSDRIDSPAVGLAKANDITPGGSSGFRTIIKQNNTQIFLLAQIAEDLQSLATDVRDIKKKILQEKGEASTGLPEDLITKLEQLTVSGEKKTAPKEKRGSFFVFKDPYKILEEEKRKS